MKILMIEKDCWAVIDQAKPEPPDAAWTEKDRKARSVIVRCVANNQLALLQSAEDARGMWEALKDVYEPQSLATRNYLRRQLIRMQYKESDDLKQFLTEFERVANEFTSTGGALDDRDKVMMLLEAMPESYRPLITALESIEDLSLTTAKARLLQEEMRQKEAPEKQFETSSAMAAKTKKKTYCYYCKKAGHKIDECRKKKKADSNPNSGNANSSHTTGNVGFSMIMHEACVALPSSDDPSTFLMIIDSGASDHMISQRQLLVDTEELQQPITVSVAESQRKMIAKIRGNMPVEIMNEGATNTGIIQNVLYVPNLQYNLLSVSRIEAAGGEVRFRQGKAEIYLKGKLTGIGQRIGKLYWITLKSTVETANVSQSVADKTDLWHRRLGHINIRSLNEMQKLGMVDGLPDHLSNELKFCDECAQGKMTQLPYSGTRERATRPLERIHSDVCGFIRPATPEGYRFFVTFTDDYTHMVAVYLMREKSDTLSCFKKYHAMATSHFGRAIARLRCDNGGEYTSNEFKNFCSENGIVTEFTPPHTPQLNGVSERLNRTINEKATTMLVESKLPEFMWGEAVMTSTYLLNRSATSTLDGITPYQMWFSKKPDVSKFIIFGSRAWVLTPKEKRTKFGPTSQLHYMVGYAENGYRLWNPQSRRIVNSRNVKFDEAPHQQLIVEQLQVQQDPEIQPSEETQSNPDTDDDNVSFHLLETSPAVQDGRPKRNIKLPARFQDFVMERNFDAHTSLCATDDILENYKDVKGQITQRNEKQPCVKSLNLTKKICGSWIVAKAEPNQRPLQKEDT